MKLDENKKIVIKEEVRRCDWINLAQDRNTALKLLGLQYSG
jgi:hypothetical protein